MHGETSGMAWYSHGPGCCLWHAVLRCSNAAISHTPAAPDLSLSTALHVGMSWCESVRSHGTSHAVVIVSLSLSWTDLGLRTSVYSRCMTLGCCMTALSDMVGGRMTTRDSMHGKCLGAL